MPFLTASIPVYVPPPSVNAWKRMKRRGNQPVDWTALVGLVVEVLHLGRDLT